MRIDQYRTEQFADEADRAAYFRMIVREAYRYQEERETQRRREDDILTVAAALRATVVHSLRDRVTIEVAEQINDHREAGHYTTLHR
jgi:hypothetical protein